MRNTLSALLIIPAAGFVLLRAGAPPARADPSPLHTSEAVDLAGWLAVQRRDGGPDNPVTAGQYLLMSEDLAGSALIPAEPNPGALLELASFNRRRVIVNGGGMWKSEQNTPIDPWREFPPPQGPAGWPSGRASQDLQRSVGWHSGMALRALKGRGCLCGGEESSQAIPI